MSPTVFDLPLVQRYIVGSCILLLTFGCDELADTSHSMADLDSTKTCDPQAELESDVRLTESRNAIFGGYNPSDEDLVVKSTIGLFSKSDPDGEFAYIDGSATLISPTVALGAAHTCEMFTPTFAIVGVNVPLESDIDFEDQYAADPLGKIALVERCEIHPDFDEENSRPNDIALFYLSHPPMGSSPAAILDPTSVLPKYVTLAGYGAHEGQFDRWWEGVPPFELRRVDSFISAQYPMRGLFKDGPNEGRGSCQGDSGGPIYIRLPTAKSGPLIEEEFVGMSESDQESGLLQQETLALEPILLGSVVMGPECNKGIGFNTDVRQYVDWIVSQPDVNLRTIDWSDGKEDEAQQITICP